jgi:hypothetical protein
VPVLAGRGPVAGPGGQDLFIDAGGRPAVVYAAWERGRVGYGRGVRSMRFDAVIAAGGSLVVAGPTVRHG